MADGQVTIKIDGDASGFENSAAKVRSSLSSLANAAGKGLTGFNKLSMTIGKTLATSFAVATTAAIGFGGAMVNIGAEFEAQMSTVSALSGATGSELAILTDKAKQLGIDTAFSATEAGKAFEYMALAGWKTEDMLNGVDGIMSAAAASGEDLGLVADIVTDSLTAFGESAQESSRLADILSATAANSNTNISMLGEAFKYAAPIAGSFGYTMEDTSIAMGLMANAGVKSSQAGTTMRSAFTRLLDPTKEVASYMDKLGISITNTDGTMKPLNEVMGVLRTSMDGLTDAEKNTAISAIFGTEALSGMLAIVNASDEDFNKLTEAVYNSAGAAQEMADIKLDNLQGQMTLLKSSSEGLALAFYDLADAELTDGVKQIIEVVNSLTEAVGSGDYDSFTEKLANAIVNGLSYLLELAPKFLESGTNLMISFIDGILDGGENLVSSAYTVIDTFVKSMKSLIPKIAKVAKTIAPVIVDAILAGLPLIYALTLELLTGFVQGIADNMDMLMETAQEMLEYLVESLTKNVPILVKAVVTIIKSFVEFIVNNMPMLLDAAFLIMTSLLQGILESIPMLIDAAIAIIQAISQFVIENLPLLIELALQIIMTLAMGLLDALPVIVEAVIQVIPAIVEALIQALPQILEAIFIISAAVVLGVLEAIPEIIKAIFMIIASIIKTLMEQMTKLSEAGKFLISAFSDGIKNSIKQVIDVAAEIVSAFINSIESKFEWIIETAKNIVNNIVEGIKSKLSEVTEIGKSIISNVINGISTMISAVRNAASNVIENIKSALTTGFNWSSIGSNIVDGIINGLAGGVGKVVSAAKNVAKSAFDAAKDFLEIKSPSRLFKREIGLQMAAGMGIGFEENVPTEQIKESLKKSTKDIKKTSLLDFSGLYNSINSSVTGAIKSNGYNSNNINTTTNNSNTTTNAPILNFYGDENDPDTMARKVNDIFTFDLAGARA